jgi:zinc transporter ZupT
MSDKNTIGRSLTLTAGIGAICVLITVIFGELASALGFAIGAGIGIFSLWSLAVAVPLLTRRNDPMAKFWLFVLLAAKLPIYAGVLIFAMTSPHVTPFAVFAGAAIMPCAVIWDVLTRALTDLRPSSRIPRPKAG